MRLSAGLFLAKQSNNGLLRLKEEVIRRRCWDLGVVTDDELLDSRLPVFVESVSEISRSSGERPIGLRFRSTGSWDDRDDCSADAPDIGRAPASHCTVSIEDVRLAAKLRAGRPGLPRIPVASCDRQMCVAHRPRRREWD